MMRNLLKVLLVSSALVAVSAPVAYAAVQETTYPAGATAEERGAIDAAYDELLAALSAPDVNAAALAAITKLRAALDPDANIGAILTGILTDIAQTEPGVDGAAFAALATAVVTIEESVDVAAVDEAAIGANLAGYEAIGAVAEEDDVVVTDPLDEDDGDDGADDPVSEN